MPDDIYALYPHLQGLDDDSLEVVAWLHQTYPQWMQYAAVETKSDETSLIVAVPAPVSMPLPAFQHDLTISTHNEEITVGFGGSHAHFGGAFYAAFIQSMTMAECCAEAQEFIDDLLTERLIVTVSVNKWGGYHRPDDETYPFLPDRDRPTYTRSWLGTYNRFYSDGL